MEMRMSNEIEPEEYTFKKSVLLKEKQRYQEILNGTDQRQQEALELSERTFNFICYARFWLLQGDKKGKRDILTTLGSNLVFKDKILNITAPEPFEIIRKSLASVSKNNDGSNLKNPLQIQSKTPSLELGVLLGSGGRIRTYDQSITFILKLLLGMDYIIIPAYR